MAASDELKDLAVRLKNLESKLETVPPRGGRGVDGKGHRRLPQGSAGVLEDGTCGINETSPCILRCNVINQGKVIPIPKPCDIECTCGPCNIYGPMVNAAAFRFRGLGG